MRVPSADSERLHHIDHSFRQQNGGYPPGGPGPAGSKTAFRPGAVAESHSGTELEVFKEHHGREPGVSHDSLLHPEGAGGRLPEAGKKLKKTQGRRHIRGGLGGGKGAFVN